MNVESIQIPPERIPPVAKEAASGSKTIAGVLFFFTVIAALAMFGTLTDETRNERRRSGDSAEEAGRKVGEVIGVLLFAGLPALFAFRSARNASRATRSIALAASDQRYSFRLSGKHIITADPHGAPRPDLSFKISGKLRTMLLAVPRAEVVDRS